MKSAGSSIAISVSLVLSLVACNPSGGGTDTTGDASPYGGNIIRTVDCGYGSIATATKIASHRFKMTLPSGECMGGHVTDSIRVELPLEVESLESGLEVSGTARIYGSNQPTFNFQVTNTSSDVLCHVNFQQIDVLDSSGNSLVQTDRHYINGDMYELSFGYTDTCLDPGRTVRVAEYLSYDFIDLSDASKLFISKGTGSIRSEPSVGTASFTSFSWDENGEVGEFVNDSGESIDLNEGYIEIEYYDDGYLVADLFLDPTAPTAINDHGEVFKLRSGRVWSREEVDTVIISLDWDAYAASGKSGMVRSTQYFSHEELHRLETLHHRQMESRQLGQ